MALSLDFIDSENDWKSDGPAISWFVGEEWLAGLLWTDENTLVKKYIHYAYKCIEDT